MEGIKKSEKLFEEAQRHLVGGVNSPVRAFKAVGGTPLFITKANGSTIEDADGRTYIDYVGSWGPMILGHAPAPVIKAAQEAIQNGTSFGAPTPAEIDLAALIKDALPSIELLRFVNSGTEATMTAIRLARAFTKRERLVKFEGGYHGHSDSLLVAAGSGATTFGAPSSPGVPEMLAKNTWVLPFNDTFELESLFQKQGTNVAAVILEPVCGNMGVVTPEKGFLEAIFKSAKKAGTLIIFDEVITGFRVGWGGAQGLFSMKPDMTCLGKIIGGGFPVGALGGRRDVMELLSPVGRVYQAGTLSGNPVAMAAGVATLRMLQEFQPYQKLEKTAKDLAQYISKEAVHRKVDVQVNQAGSMFTVFFTDQKVNSYFAATLADTKKYAAFFQALLKRGIYFPPAQFEAAFISTAHSERDMEKTKKAISEALGEVAKCSADPKEIGGG